MLRISPSMGHTLDVNLALRHLLFLLEYCMVTGYDWWDILLHVQPTMVQSLVERLHEEYTRQKAALQQVARCLVPPSLLPCSSPGEFSLRSQSPR